jgi:hypothetical protein
MNNREQLFEQFVTQPENTISLEFVRDEEPGRSFSPETHEQLNDAFLAFVAARSQRWFAEHPGKGMTRLSVSIRVEHE